VATELLGGLTPAARDKQLGRLTASPYLQSSILTPAQEVALVQRTFMREAMEHTRALSREQAGDAVKELLPAAEESGAEAAPAASGGKTKKHAQQQQPSPPPSARGSRPLKAATNLAHSTAAASAARADPRADRLKVGGSAAAIEKHKLAQQKLRLDQQIYDAAYFRFDKFAE